MTHKNGYTLIELMVVIAILGIVSSIAIPKFSDLIRKSKEGTTRAHLGSLRSALTIYYADTEGIYPYTLETLIIEEKYISKIPSAWTFEYGEVDEVTNTRI
jgi:general secretion pathway protein G